MGDLERLLKLKNPERLQIFSEEHESLKYKRLLLQKPGQVYDQYGISASEPIFTSSTDSIPQIYQVGNIVGTPGFFDSMDVGGIEEVEDLGDNIAVLKSMPRVGIGYWEQPSMIISSSGRDCFGYAEIRSAWWIGVLEPVGTPVTWDDYWMNFNRIAEAVEVIDIWAFCGACHDGPLRSGVVVDPKIYGGLVPLCSTENHPKEKDRVYAGFEFYADGKFFLK